jgi:hypothetical protein
MENLYGYYFHYNPFKGCWYALDTNTLQDYHAGKLKEKDLLKSEDIKDLIAFLSDPNAKIKK